MQPLRSVMPGGAAVSAFALVLALAPVGAASADELPIGSDQDITAPAVTALSVSPTEVDVRDNTNKTIAVTATATDDLSGVVDVQLSYRSPSGNQLLSASMGATRRTSGTALSGSYASTITVTPLHPDGTWTLTSVRVTDAVGNYRIYGANDGVAPASLTVHSNADDVAPDMSAVSVNPGTLDVSDAVKVADVSVDFIEDGSGLDYVFGVFTSPSGRQSATFVARQAGTPGVAIGTTYVAQYSEPGAWNLTFVCGYDRARNQRCYNSTSSPTLASKFGPLALDVVSDPQDREPPTVSAYRLSPTQIDVTDGPARVTTELDVADDLSGVSFAYIRFDSPRTVGATPEVISRYGYANTPSIYRSVLNSATGTFTVTEDDSLRVMSGTLDAVVDFPRYDRSGDWKVASVCVVDNVNRQRCYTPTSSPALDTLGPTGLQVEWNRTPVVAVTGVTEGTYLVGEEPTPGCSVSDLEDGTVTDVEPTVTGPDAEGVVTVRCSYTDTGGVTGSATKTYILVTPFDAPPEVSVTGVTEETYYEGSEPTAGCAVTDAEDGTVPGVEPTVTGPDAEGDVTVECSYTDTGGNMRSATASYRVVPVPNTPPTVEVTGVDASTYEHGSEPDPGCSVTDLEDAGASAAPVVARPAGPLGLVTVTCSYTDTGGLEDSASVMYSVVDTTAPALVVSDRTTPATSAAGAVVSFSPTATDGVDPDPSVSCSPASGTTYPIGTTTVSCTAEDSSGNQTTRTFTVTVTPACTGGPIQQPVNPNGSSVFKLGSAVPLKVSLSSCYGTTPADVAPTVSLRHLDRTPDGTVNEVVSTWGGGDAGTTMRYDGSGTHSYVLSSKNSQFCVSGSAMCSSGALVVGTYELKISAPELPTPVRVLFNLRK